MTETSAIINELINILIDFEDSGKLDAESAATLERARVIWHRLEHLPYPPISAATLKVADFQEIYNSRHAGSCADVLYVYQCPVCGASVSRCNTGARDHDGRKLHVAWHRSTTTPRKDPTHG